MNKEWAELNKEFQNLISKRNSFNNGIDKLLELRKSLFDMLLMINNEFPNNGYSLQPLINSKGYDSKTMAYSIYHILRIEDIVCHRLIAHDEEIFDKNNYQARLNSPIKTTGNELIREEIEEFSKKLNINELMNYLKDVYESSNEIIKKLTYDDLKIKITSNDKEELIKANVVSDSEEAIWLIDYWCSKDILGLLKMPFSRHWIMHVEAFLRIKNEIIKREKKKG